MADELNLNPDSSGKKPILLNHQDISISDETQMRLNQPIKHPSGLQSQDQVFLAMMMEKIEKGEIDLYRPSTLLNLPVYEKLNEVARGKADFDSVNLLASIREIRRLWLAGDHDTYQIENLVHRFRTTKERLEEAGGDLFIL